MAPFIYQANRTEGPTVSAQANLRQQVKLRSGDRSQNSKVGERNVSMTPRLQATVSAQANLRQQVKHSGRNQNRRLAKGVPV